MTISTTPFHNNDNKCAWNIVVECGFVVVFFPPNCFTQPQTSTGYVSPPFHLLLYNISCSFSGYNQYKNYLNHISLHYSCIFLSLLFVWFCACAVGCHVAGVHFFVMCCLMKRSGKKSVLDRLPTCAHTLETRRQLVVCIW